MELHPPEDGLKVYTLGPAFFSLSSEVSLSWLLHLRLLPLSPPPPALQVGDTRWWMWRSRDGSSWLVQLRRAVAAVWHLWCAALCGPEEWGLGTAATTLFSVLCSKSWQPEGRVLEERQVSVTINNTTGFVVLLNLLVLFLPAEGWQFRTAEASSVVS